jgi:TPR repeat protein
MRQALAEASLIPTRPGVATPATLRPSFGHEDAEVLLARIQESYTVADLMRAAEYDPDSAYLVALAYDNAIGVERDEREFSRWARAAARGDDPAGLHLQGYELLTGRGEAALDLVQGERLLRRAAEGGFAKSEVMLARLYRGMYDTHTQHWRRNAAQAIPLLIRAAARGSRDANFDLGEMYDAGEGTRRDRARALNYYRDAAELGSPEAQFHLCRYYEIRDTAQARRQCLLAVAANHRPAQTMLGRAYLAGNALAGGRRDYDQAFDYLTQAIEEDRRASGRRLPNDPVAYCYLSHMYAEGLGRRADRVEARRLSELGRRARQSCSALVRSLRRP